MTDIDNCFICLDNCNKRICSECKCFAHDKCFAEYINKNMNIQSLIKHTDEMIELNIFFFISCPVCKKEIENHNKRITRSDTHKFRYNFAVYMLNYYLFLINNDTSNDIYAIQNLLEKIMKIVVKFKSILLKNERFSKFIKNKLKIMNGIWPKANLYYYEIYGTQLKV